MSRLLLISCAFALAAAGCASCVDLSVAKPFPCSLDAGDEDQCPSGWRCGYANRCFDAAPDAGAPLACSEDRHCADGWRCGRGIDGGASTCHAAGVGGAYACTVETETQDCDEHPAWRCDPVTAVCVNVTENLLQSSITTTFVEQLSPRPERGVPSQVAVGRIESLPPMNGRGGVFRTIAFTTDAGLTVALNGNELQLLPDGGVSRIFMRTFAENEATVRSLAAFDSRVAIVYRDGKLRIANGATGGIDDFPLTARAVVPLDPMPGMSRFSRSPARAVAFGKDWVRVITLDGGVALPLPSGASFTDVLDVSGSEEEFLVLDGTLLWHADPAGVVQDGGIALELGAVDAPGIKRLYTLRRGPSWPLLLGEVDRGDAGLAWGVLERAGGCQGRDCFRMTSGPCVLCPSGLPPLQVSVTHAELPGSGPQIYARCPAGGVVPVPRTWRVRLHSSRCEPGFSDSPTYEPVDEDEEPFAFGFTPASASGTFRAFGGSGGRVWWADDSTGVANPAAPLHPFVLDRAPAAVLRFSQSLGAISMTRVFAMAGSSAFELAEPGLVSQVLASDEAQITVLGTVQGRPGIVIASDLVFNVNATTGGDSPQIIARLDKDLPPLTAPTSAAIFSQTPARSVLVVTSRDALFAADVTDQLQTRLPDGGGIDGTIYPPAKLTQRLAPTPGVPIRDIAVGRRVRVEPGTEAPLATFFVLARSEIYEVDVFSDTRWAVTPIPLAPQLGEPLELWTEFGANCRLAYASGVISALPVPIPLGQKLPQDGKATDFARMCGETFAIVGNGVKHYRTDAGWEDVAGVSLNAQEQAGARFFETTNALFLATGQGRVLELFVARDGGVAVCR